MYGRNFKHLFHGWALSPEAREPTVSVSMGIETKGFERLPAKYEFLEWGSTWNGGMHCSFLRESV